MSKAILKIRFIFIFFSVSRGSHAKIILYSEVLGQNNVFLLPFKLIANFWLISHFHESYENFEFINRRNGTAIPNPEYFLLQPSTDGYYYVSVSRMDFNQSFSREMCQIGNFCAFFIVTDFCFFGKQSLFVNIVLLPMGKYK